MFHPVLAVNADEQIFRSTAFEPPGKIAEAFGIRAITPAQLEGHVRKGKQAWRWLRIETQNGPNAAHDIRTATRLPFGPLGATNSLCSGLQWDTVGDAAQRSRKRPVVLLRRCLHDGSRRDEGPS